MGQCKHLFKNVVFPELLCCNLVPFYESWKLYDISKVDWSQLPPQTFRWMGMLMVVAFSSSLDVAAIEMELGLPLDYDR